MRARTVRLVSLGVAASLVATCASRAEDPPGELEPAEASYTYDSLGRLRSVTDADGTTAVYDYDAVGNIVGISRADSIPEDAAARSRRRGPVVSAFSPNVVAPGDKVTISGRRFSDDPLLDAVTVDGRTYASVESAGADELVVTVPPTAGSGRLTVATPDGSAKSTDDLIVVPFGVSPDDVDAARRVRLGRGTEVSADSQDSVTLLTFPGDSGQRIELRSGPDDDEFALCRLELGLAGPGGVELGSPDDFDISCEDGRQDLGFLPTTGRYTLLVRGRDSGEPVSLTLIVDEGDPDAPTADESEDEDAADEEQEEPAAEFPPGFDMSLLEPPVFEDPGPSAAPGGLLDGAGAFPVDLTTGQPAFEQTDMFVDDVMPLWLTRGYRASGKLPTGLDQGSFGLGSVLDFDLDLRTSPGFQFAEVLMPTGAPISFVRTNDGTEAEDAVFEHAATPTFFYGAQITWNGSGWDLAMQDGTTMRFGGRRESPLEAIVDRQGNAITIRRGVNQRGEPTDNVLSVHSPSGRWIGFTYDGEDRIISARDNIGRTVSYGYDDDSWRGRLSTVTYPSGQAVSYGYDEENRLSSITGPDGAVVVTNEFSDSGRVTRQTLADGSTFSFAYVVDPATGMVTQADVTDPTGLVRRVTVDTGRWLSDSYAVGTPAETTVTFERDPTSRFVTTVVGPDGRRESFGYDDAGNVVTQSGPSDSSDSGDDSALTTEFAYEPDLHQVESISDPAGQGTSFRYDDAGNLVSQVDRYGAKTTYRYDSRNRMVRLTDAAGGTTTIDYELSHRITVTDPSGHSRSEFYDGAGRLAAVTDPSGDQTRLGYDELDRVTSVVDPAGSSTSFEYDAAGNVASITDAAGNTTAYAYDGLGRVTRRTDPAGASDSYSYDAAGNVVSHTDRRGVVSTFSYDAFGRRTGAAFGGESTVAYAYDPAGRLVSVTDSAYGNVQLAYDGLDRLVGETTPSGGVAYAYDAVGRRTEMAPADGPATTYRYDDGGRLDAIAQGSELTVGASRDSLGRVVGLDLPNGLTAGYRYDERGNVAAVEFGNGSDDSALGDLGYRYDAAGRRVATTGSLAKTTLPPAVADDSARHDAGNRVVAWDDADLAYDAAGNLQSDGTNTYTWDARGQLVTVDGPVDATFTYDPFGRRSSKTVAGITTAYTYDGPNLVTETVDGGDPVRYLTGLAPDETFARSDAGDDGSVTTYLRDAQGSVLGLAGSDGTIDTRYSYDPFGRTTVSGDDATDPNPFAYTGRELDETGLYYYRARYYSPELGRFLSEDPLGFAAGDPNLYAYVGNDPLNLVDPSGQQPGFSCVGPALDLFLQVMALFDQYLILLKTPGITREQFSIASDNLLRQADAARIQFYIACGAELFLIPGLTHLVGRGLTAFGRTPAGTRLATQFTSRFGSGSSRQALGAADNVAAEVASIGGQAPRNSGYAGQVFTGRTWTPELQARYPGGVRFTEQGFPDFSPYALKTVKSDALLTGDVSRDLRALGLTRLDDYRWHHVEDGLTMQLVPTDIHEAVRHTGGAAVSRTVVQNLFCALSGGC